MIRRLRRLVALFCILTLLVTSISHWSVPKQVEASENVDTTSLPSVFLDGFENVTASDFTDLTGNTIENGQAYTNGNYFLTDENGTRGVSYENKLLSLGIVFEEAGDGTQLIIAGQDKNNGFMLYPTNDTLYMTQIGGSLKLTNDGPELFPIRFEAMEAGVESFINTPFVLQISFEYGNFDSDEATNDVKLGFFFNGKLYNHQHVIITDCNMENFGGGLGLVSYYEGKAIRVTSVVPTPIKPIYLEGFRHVTTSSFQNSSGTSIIDGQEYTSGTYYLKDITGAYEESLDRTLLSMNINLEESGTYSQFIVAGQSKSNALMIYPINNERLFLNQLGTMATDKTKLQTEFNADIAGVDSFEDMNFLLQISFEYGNFDDDDLEDDVQLGFYFNGKLYNNQHHIVYDCVMENFGTCLGFEGYEGNTVTVSSVVPENENLTHVAWDDMIKADTRQSATETVFLTSLGKKIYQTKDHNITDMASTAFEAKISLETAGVDTRVYFGGKNPEHGIILHAWEDGNLWMQTWSISPDLGLEDVLVFDKDIAGVETFLNKEFRLTITTEFADYDGNGTADDVQLGFYFNGKLYQNQYLYAYDCKADFGTYFTVYPITGEIIIHDAEHGYEIETHHLWSEGDYELDEAEGEEILVNGKIVKDSVLRVPGDYMLTSEKSDGTAKKVVLYDENDEYPDDGIDIRDLVATLKVNQGQSAKYLSGTLSVQTGNTSTMEVRERLLNSMDKEESNAVSFEFIGGSDVMPLAGFNGPHHAVQDWYRKLLDVTYPEFVTQDWLNTIAAAGINLISQTDIDYNLDAYGTQQLLEYCKNAGVGLFVSDGYIDNLTEQDEIDVNALSERIKDYSDSSAFCGSFVVDEPRTEYYSPSEKKKNISAYEKIAKALQSDLGIFSFFNMMPISGIDQDNNQANYEDYVEEFCSTIKPKVLMWDKYPFSSGDGTDVYFYNMDLVRRNAKANGIPFWAAIQAGAQWNDDKLDLTSAAESYPDQEQFNWNVNTCLAYGVQGFNYFPLIQPLHFAYAPNNGYDFARNGMIGADGRLNKWYGYAQTMNKHIGAIDYVLMNSVNQGILLNVTDAGTKAEKPDTFLNTKTYPVPNFLADFSRVEQSYILGQGVDNQWSVENKYIMVSESRTDGPKATWREVTDVNGNVMIGCFNYNGKTALYVVNYDMDNAQPNVTLTLDKEHRVRRIQQATTHYEIKSELTLDMQAGEGVLLVID